MGGRTVGISSARRMGDQCILKMSKRERERERGRERTGKYSTYENLVQFISKFSFPSLYFSRSTIPSHNLCSLSFSLSPSSILISVVCVFVFLVFDLFPPFSLSALLCPLFQPLSTHYSFPSLPPALSLPLSLLLSFFLLSDLHSA